MNATHPLSSVPYLLDSSHGSRRNHYGRRLRLQTPEVGRLILYAVALQAVLIAAWVHFLS